MKLMATVNDQYIDQAESYFIVTDLLTLPTTPAANPPLRSSLIPVATCYITFYLNDLKANNLFQKATGSL